jgi:heme/copper-type cytochrome/quinol oxidase subunit 2
MPLAAFLVQAAAETGEHHGNVMLETAIYGIIALAVFALLALVTFSYRDVANRHAAKAEAYAKAHGAHSGHDDGAGHGH